MRKLLAVIMLATVALWGCGGGNLDFAVEKAPVYEYEVASDFIITIKDKDEAITGVKMQAILEMAKMDHGIIEVPFIDNGDGTYTGAVELPMGGEWIASIEASKDGKDFEEVLTFDVKER